MGQLQVAALARLNSKCTHLFFLPFLSSGSAIVFVAILKQFVLKDILKRYQWVGIVLNCLSIVLVGFTAMMIEASNSAGEIR